MVAGDVVDLCPFLRQMYEVLNDLHVGLREVALFKIPDVYDIPVEDDLFGADTFKILK